MGIPSAERIRYADRSWWPGTPAVIPSVARDLGERGRDDCSSSHLPPRSLATLGMTLVHRFVNDPSPLPRGARGGVTWSIVHCFGGLSGLHRRNFEPWRKRPCEK